jgi:hypothetical protein
VDGARARFAENGLTGRTTITGGSFRTDALPFGADAISLVRVLYDHSDDTVRMLLAKVHAALPDGGRLIVAEPMSGGQTPIRAPMPISRSIAWPCGPAACEAPRKSPICCMRPDLSRSSRGRPHGPSSPAW